MRCRKLPFLLYLHGTSFRGSKGNKTLLHFFTMIAQVLLFMLFLFWGATSFYKQSWKRLGLYWGFFLVGVGLLYAIELYFVFLPLKGPAHPLGTPHHFSLAEVVPRQMNLVSYPQDHSQELRGLFYTCGKKGEDKKNRKVVLFFHGRRQTTSMGHEWGKTFCNIMPCDLFIASYRGYGANEGFIGSQKALQEDAEVAYHFLLAQGYLEKNIILFGFSLGGVASLHLAKHYNPGAVILKSTFTQLKKSIVHTFSSFGLPHWVTKIFVLPFLLTRINNMKNIEKVKSPMLLIYSTKDKIVPFAHGKRFAQRFENLGVDVKFLTYDDTHAFYHEDFTRQILAFLAEKKILDHAMEGLTS